MILKVAGKVKKGLLIQQGLGSGRVISLLKKEELVGFY